MKDLLVKYGLPFIIAIITAIITSKITIREEVKKQVYERREDLYIKLFDLLVMLSDNPYSVFNHKDFIMPLRNLRSELNLFASNDLINSFEPLYNIINKTFIDYTVKIDETYLMSLDARKENGETNDDFEREQDEYQKHNLIDENTVMTCKKEIIDIMRNDMGTR